MFRPHYSTCSCGCNRYGVIVVKAGLLKQCNERMKDKKQQSRKEARMQHKKKIKKVKEKRKKLPSISRLKKKADALHSLWIRLLHSKRNRVLCYTCDVKKPVKEMQNGHYISRGCMALRYKDYNCRPQCVACNIFKKGNYQKYAIRLEREVPGILERLEAESKTTLHMNRYDYQVLIQELESKLSEIQK